MSKYYAYIRVSTDKQTLENQKHKILEFAFNKKIQIEDFIEVEVSSKKTQKERLIDDLFLKLDSFWNKFSVTKNCSDLFVLFLVNKSSFINKL